MMILWDEKIAFLAVPKTGSTAIEGALAPHSAMLFRNPPHMKHMTLRGFVRFFDSNLKNSGLNDVKTMAIMREPVDWLGSWYRYRHRDELVGKKNSTREVTFDQFVQEYCKPNDRLPFANIGSQSQFLSGGSTGIALDHLFRYQDWSKIVSFLEKITGKPLKMRNRNVSPKFEITVSKKTQSLLEDVNAIDFETYAALGNQ